MKCQRCKEREANVQIVQQELGKKPQTFILCDVCAREMGLSIPTFNVPVKLNNPFAVMGNAFQTTLGIGADDLQKRRVTRCSRCNLTFDEFRKTGFLGCPDCYEAFGSQLDPVFCRTQMGKTHLGRHLAEKMKHRSHKKLDEEDDGSAQTRFEEKVVVPDEAQREALSTEATEALDRESRDITEMDRKQRTKLIAQKNDELDAAIAREDYLSAARLRDEITGLKAKGE